MSSDKFSSAPSYPSQYTPDDYDEDGKLKRLKEIPLFDRPMAMTSQLDAHTNDMYVGPDKPVRKIEVSKPPVQDAKTALKAPPQFVSPDHYIAVVSYLETRHPDEERIIAHYAEQQIAKKAGTYNPHEDAPVLLNQLTPRLAIKVLRTFSVAEAQIDNGNAIRSYVSDFSKISDENVISLECGCSQPLPVDDSVRGEYKEDLLNQFMQSFYDRTEKARKNVIQRAKTPATVAKE
jgi:hypothetical protein